MGVLEGGCSRTKPKLRLDPSPKPRRNFLQGGQLHTLGIESRKHGPQGRYEVVGDIGARGKILMHRNVRDEDYFIVIRKK